MNRFKIRFPRARIPGLTSVAATVLTAAMPAVAATMTWDGVPSGTGTNWHEAVNWSGDTKPGPADTAQISLAGANVWMTTDEEVTSMEMGTTINVSPLNLTLASGTLTITNGLVYIGKMSNTYARVRQIGGHFVGGGPTASNPGHHLMLGGYRNAEWGGTGEWELVDGTLTMQRGRHVYVGYGGGKAFGRFIQTGGQVHLWGGNFILAQGGPAKGLYVIEGGTNTCSQLVVGSYGIGVVTQSAGLVNCTNGLYVGVQPGSDGTYVLQGGTLRCSAFTMGSSGGRARFFQNGGVVTNSGGATLGDDKTPIVELLMSDGLFYSGNTYLGSGTGSTGTWVQTGGEVRVAELRIGNYGLGVYVLSNGVLSASGLVRMGMYASADGTLEVYGGSLSAASDWMGQYSVGRRRIRIVGTGCTNFAVTGSFDYGGADSTLRVDLDGTPQGVTPIMAGGSSFNLSTCKLEVAVQDGVYRSVNETFELIRIPQVQSFITNAITISTVTPGYGFTWSVLTNVGGYDKLILTCTQAPSPRPGGSVFVIR